MTPDEREALWATVKVALEHQGIDGRLATPIAAELEEAGYRRTADPDLGDLHLLDGVTP